MTGYKWYQNISFADNLIILFYYASHTRMIYITAPPA
jgi:hypothetical protein